jgi:hypothetical protein
LLKSADRQARRTAARAGNHSSYTKKAADVAIGDVRGGPVSDSLPILIGLAVVVGLLLLRARRAAARAPSQAVQLRDLPRVLERLEAEGGDGAFAGFLATPAGGKAADDMLSVQFSIEDGRAGLDWLLLQPANVAAQARFERLAAERGHYVVEAAVDDVQYLRVEDGDIAALAVAVMQQLCGLGETDAVVLLTDGFTWPAGG